MNEQSLQLSNRILLYLSQNPNKKYSLEELSAVFQDSPNQEVSSQKLQQARILEILIFLSDSGLIALDPFTDKSSIKISCLN